MHNIKDEIAGGLSGAVLVVPTLLGCGIVIFQPLGDQYTAAGILAAFASAIIISIVSGWIRGKPVHLSSPKTALSVIVATLISQVSGLDSFQQTFPDPVRAAQLLMAVAFVSIVLAGLIQLALGALRLGQIVKFVPHPVIAGFMNGLAGLIILYQLPKLLGLGSRSELLDVLFQKASINPYSLLLGLFTMAVFVLSKRFIKRIPPTLTAILTGTVFYYGVSFLFESVFWGNTVGSIPARMPFVWQLPDFIELLPMVSSVQFLSVVASASVTMAFIMSIQTLLSAAASDVITKTRHDGNRELISQGIGNIANGFMGGMLSSGSYPHTKAVYDGRGRTRISSVANGVFLFLFISVLSGFLTLLPIPVLAATVIIMTAGLSDEWTRTLFNNLKKAKDWKMRRPLVLNLFLIIIVAALVLFGEVLIAVSLGMILAFFAFLQESSKSVIRAQLSGAAIHSRSKRSHDLTELLNREGKKIAILYLEGPLFFGSADRIARVIGELTEEGVKYIVLDMMRVSRIDSTGAYIIQQAFRKLRGRDIHLILSRIREGDEKWNALDCFGLMEDFQESSIFSDTNSAIEWCENHLIADLMKSGECDRNVSLNGLLGLSGLDVEVSAMIADYISRSKYNDGELIIKQNEVIDGIYFVTSGSARVEIALAGTKKDRYLYSLGPGTYFGEKALADKPVSPVTVRAASQIVCYCISTDNMNSMRKNDPELALAILNSIINTSASHLSVAYDIIVELER